MYDFLDEITEIRTSCGFRENMIREANALTSGEFTEFIEKNGINEFFVAGADATGCVKSTCFNMTKAGYSVHVISDCVTSYDLKKMDEMYAYYAKNGCEVKELKDYSDIWISAV